MGNVNFQYRSKKDVANKKNKVMKKILMILVVLPFIFASCSDDDDILKSDIVGTWVQESVVPKEVKTNNEVATKAIKDDIISYNQNNTEMFVFSDDGKIT